MRELKRTIARHSQNFARMQRALTKALHCDEDVVMDIGSVSCDTSHSPFRVSVYALLLFPCADSAQYQYDMVTSDAKRFSTLLCQSLTQVLNVRDDTLCASHLRCELKMSPPQPTNSFGAGAVGRGTSKSGKAAKRQRKKKHKHKYRKVRVPLLSKCSIDTSMSAMEVMHAENLNEDSEDATISH